MTDHTIRNLAHLRLSASTARVLNLLKVSLDHGHTTEWAQRPLFQTWTLNRSLIIKHRLRRDEMDVFEPRRQVATKVIIPLDAADLRTGGRYVFVGQKGFDRSVREAFGINSRHPDIATLRLLDRLPSLDPFLLREQLKREGIEPAHCYFSISEADQAQMVRFVEDEIRPLVTLSLGPDLEDSASTQRLAAKILSDDPHDRMEALRETLRLEVDDYEEGAFCWKGFLYYKWVLAGLMGEVAAVALALRTIKPVGTQDRASREFLEGSRAELHSRLLETCSEVKATLAIYDDAYAGLTADGRPTAFRDFLLEAPRLFTRLGDQLGTIQHIVSFWRFRFGANAAPVSVEELIDIFMDFKSGLAGHDDGGYPVLAA